MYADCVARFLKLYARAPFVPPVACMSVIWGHLLMTMALSFVWRVRNLAEMERVGVVGYCKNICGLGEREVHQKHRRRQSRG
jgi:hypothetical protein